MDHDLRPNFPNLEALAELAFAFALTRLSERRYFALLGLARIGEVGEPPRVSPGDLFDARVAGHAVTRMAARVPFRAVCLQQAIATHRMLARRGIPSEIRFGVRLTAGQLGDPRDPDAAHAWVMAGDAVVNGLIEGLGRFVVVGRYA